jgi:broad specificity phosphatase PhoE
MRLYIARHGESLDDIEDCYGGIADFPLTDSGRKQALETAGQLQDLAVTMIFSSPLSRALETAAIIADQLHLPPPVVIDELQERNTYGVLSGVNKDQAKILFKSVLAQLTEKPGYSKQTILGGEDYELFVQRVSKALDIVVRHASDLNVGTAVVVTHGKFTQALFERVLRLGSDVMPQLGSINAVDYEQARAIWVPRPFSAT